MKPKTMILMVVAIGCGLGASYMTSKLLAERDTKTDAEPTVPVLVAKARIPGGHPIKEPEKQFEVKQFPQSVAPKRALSSFAELKDQRLKAPLEEGKYVLQDDLVSKESASMEHLLMPGQRAIAIKVNPESTAGGFVLPGSHVDIIHTTRGGEGTAKVLLQNMLVLAVDATDTRNGDTKTIIGQTVTIAATLEESTRLSLAGSNGDLRLVLKSATDNKRTGNIVVKASDLDKPLKEKSPDAEPAEPVATNAAPTQALPEIPPEQEKQPEPEKPKPVEEPRPPVRKVKPHVLTIINGLNRDKTTFMPQREDNPGEDSTDPDAAPPEKPEDKAKSNGAKKAPAPVKGS